MRKATILKLILAKNPLLAARRLIKTERVIAKAIQGNEFASCALPLRLQIEVTDRCNFACMMCARQTAKIYNQDITYATFHKLIGQLRPLYVTLNGSGEPLLNQDIHAMLRLCRARQITTAMPTNMLLMDGLTAQRILETPPNYLTFSLHATTPELFHCITSSTGFQACLKNFEDLLLKIDRRKLVLRILCTLQSANLNHYRQMFALIKKWGLLHNVVLAAVFNYGPYTKQVIPGKQQLKETIADLDDELAKCQESDKKAFLNIWRQELLNLEYRPDTETSAPCLIPWYSTFIKANGDVMPCCYITSEEFVMGNIYSSSFAQIWNGKKYREFRIKITEDRLGLKTCKSCWNDNAAVVKRYTFLTLGKTNWKI